MVFDPEVIWIKTAWVIPLKMAETTIQPEADGRAVAEKPTPTAPGGTVTVAGTGSAALLLERLTTTFPVEFDIMTTHIVVEPAGMLVGTQMS